MAVAPDVTLHGTMVTIFTIPTDPAPLPEIGSLELALCGYGSETPRVAGEAILSRVTQPIAMQAANLPGPGEFEIIFYSNGLIIPPGTYYTITTKNSNGDIVQTEAYLFEPGSWDLSNLIPYDPNLPPPPLRPPILNLLLIVPFSGAPVFPGDVYASWQITLNGDVSPQFTNLVDGNLYTIIVIQDGNGQHNFPWPGNVFNATLVNPSPNGMTVQTFVAVSELLYPIGAGTYYP